MDPRALPWLADVTPAELHAWLTARWQEWADTARAAGLHTPAPWRADVEPWATNGVGVVDANDDGVAVAIGSYVADHIAAAAPDRIIAVCEAALRALERHRLMLLNGPGNSCHPACYYCSSDQDPNDYEPWPCPDVLDLASVWATRGDCPEELRR